MIMGSSYEGTDGYFHCPRCEGIMHSFCVGELSNGEPYEGGTQNDSSVINLCSKSMFLSVS